MRRLFGEPPRRAGIQLLSGGGAEIRENSGTEQGAPRVASDRPAPPFPTHVPEEDPDPDEPLPLDEPPGPIHVPQPGSPPPMRL